MNQKIKLSVLVVELVAIVGLMALNFRLSTTPASTKVLAQITAQPTPTWIPTSTPRTPLVEAITKHLETPEHANSYKESYVIAFIGDSMIETMGAGLPYVYKELKNKYPEVEFSLYNYGIGSENIVEGISRFALPYSYKGQEHEPLPELGADIIVLGSYSYNPITPFDKNEAWLLLSDLINKAKGKADKVYVLAEQAPLTSGFGKGPGGVNWPEEITKSHTENIVTGLENALGLAETLGVGLINVFEQSRPEFVATHDGVHYSEEGQEFTAKVIVETIELPQI